MSLRHGERIGKRRKYASEKFGGRRSWRRLFHRHARQSFVRIEIALTSATSRAPGILFRSYFLRGPWFSFFRLHLYNRDVLRCNEELHIFNIILIGARVRAHTQGACEHTKETVIHQYTQRRHLHRVYVYTYHGTYEIKYIQ